MRPECNSQKEETKHNKREANKEPAWRELFQKKNISDKYYSPYSKKLKRKYSLQNKLKEDTNDITIREERMTRMWKVSLSRAGKK